MQRFLKYLQAARYMGISLTSLNALIDKGLITAVYFDRQKRIDKKSIDDYAFSRKVKDKD